ncbi:PREDICTED: centromere protein X isoform X2 [Myotis brandtii]|uniref:centromere protein X isoform X2 n=1 Tax=Myotis brandtii TaxID=109478 RepID=UPI0003BBAA59|nr:PREDICTED: centromere protein X isoform X2 [Myotis brandtii]
MRVGGAKVGRAHSSLAGSARAGLRGAQAAVAVMEGTSASFRKELVSKLLHLHFKDDKTKVSGDALLLVAELLKVFVVEATVRSIRQAQAEDLPCVDVEQLEKVLPQLVLRLPCRRPGRS